MTRLIHSHDLVLYNRSHRSTFAQHSYIINTYIAINSKGSSSSGEITVKTINMPPVTLPPSFYNSFWSPDYRSGLDVLFKNLEQVGHATGERTRADEIGMLGE